MALYPDRNYRSAITEFLQQLKKDRPHLEVEQRAGRALLWDRPVRAGHRLEQAQFKRGSVAQKAYPYQTAPLPSLRP